MADIHRQDVKELLAEKREIIEEKRSKFEKYRTMTDLINNIQVKKRTIILILMKRKQ